MAELTGLAVVAEPAVATGLETMSEPATVFEQALLAGPAKAAGHELHETARGVPAETAG